LIVVDRTTFHELPADRLTVQRVPPVIYAASYPAWILSHSKFLSFMGGAWRPVSQFESYASGEAAAVNARLLGFIFEAGARSAG
jgi:hypothetical protein